MSRSAWRTHRRNTSTGQPIFSATDRIAPHCDGYSGACSKTIRTARSRNSGEYLLRRPMGPILPLNGPSDKAGTIQGVIATPVGAISVGIIAITLLLAVSMTDTRLPVRFVTYTRARSGVAAIANGTNSTGTVVIGICAAVSRTVTEFEH